MQFTLVGDTRRVGGGIPALEIGPRLVSAADEASCIAIPQAQADVLFSFSGLVLSHCPERGCPAIRTKGLSLGLAQICLE